MWDPILLMYPVYLMVLKTAIITAMVLGRERIAQGGLPSAATRCVSVPAVPMAASAAVLAARPHVA